MLHRFSTNGLILRKTLFAASIFLTAYSLPASAAPTWTFWSGPMSQYEGGLKLSSDNRISYGCTDFSSSYDIVVPGKHTGVASLYIDGKEFREVIMNAAPDGQSSNFHTRVTYEDTKSAKRSINNLIDALAAGREASLRSRDGITTYGSFPLNGSAKAKVCKID
ncbi:hypothetical protein [Paracoccus aestuariivivens]|uniref:Uncharacterized protein n=1 Tax=Paracoccus aestuariivivens TaxID=1820333 RepID=A0A6L6J820_9RHOB|nr:hypothetical protein [Paracoccus aestuariivivens]MTH77318.1 hypothetical protein [Paracoccus aestuariivivens]